MFVYDCAVCGSSTTRHVTLLIVEEVVHLCSDRCEARFLRDPVSFLGAAMAASEEGEPGGSRRAWHGP